MSGADETGGEAAWAGAATGFGRGRGGVAAGRTGKVGRGGEGAALIFGSDGWDARPTGSKQIAKGRKQKRSVTSTGSFNNG